MSQDHAPSDLPHVGAPLLSRLLDVIETEIAPMTARGVEAGNKIFGAALLRKSDLSLVLAETNNEIENPLWHGEMHCLKRFYEQSPRPETRDLIFLSTHEPCSLCLSAITWSGFDNFFYFFSHSDSRDSFAIPHDLRILSEVFGLEDGGYRRRNAYWTAREIRAEIADLDASEREDLEVQARRINRLYDGFSETYQASKAGGIPLD
ncbi:tRNA(Arg) A34 adenosine deaminase TadA [Palleronia aestuarii]|uniref:tRNA(Arg) A34 adenosine deaminase TadA n=1 Tax=Palleronia aestuarii TaxID=568105 RepID=A0A2W7NH47_9RHOB|nr:nucleoside deaminase [Palleronia aestuarii]PZX10592.1 tRNA(Arg) A34 adenosine deaminase TadA [Palleronia aestuarii]